MTTIFPATPWIIFLACIATLRLLCWLPYQAALSPTFSDSYLFGYSNHTALAVVGVFAASIALLAAYSCRLEEQAIQHQPMPQATLSRALWFAFALTLAFHLIVRRTGGYIESPYFLDRIKLVLAGRVPYRDFEYAYGASFLYVPAGIAHYLHLSAADAYGLFWIALTLVGVWMLFLTVQWSSGPLAVQHGIFLFLFAMSMIVVQCTGVNYSMFRFILPCFFGLLVYRGLNHVGQHASKAKSILLVAPCFVALLLVSPEMALSFAVGMAFYLAIFVDLRVRSNLVSFLAMLLLVALFARIASAWGVFITLNAFRSGGFNFPLMPAPAIILFLGAVAFTSAYAGVCIRARNGHPMMVLIAVSVAAIAGALGRCDPAHVLFNPVGLWIAALTLAATRPRIGRFALWTCALIFVFIPIIYNIKGMIAEPSRAALLTLFAAEGPDSETKVDRFAQRIANRVYGSDKASSKINKARSFAALHDGLDVSSIYGYSRETILQAPFQFSPDNFGPIHTPQVETGYFYAIVNLVTPEEVEKKVAELRAHPERPLLLAEGAESGCAVSPAGELQTIRTLFLYPYAAPVRHTGSILEPICDYIRVNYTLSQSATPERLGYAVWVRR